MTWIKRLYIVFVGIILSLTVGFGISVLYPEPQMPQYPQTAPYVTIPSYCYNTTPKTPECEKYTQQQQENEAKAVTERANYDKQVKEYQTVASEYTRTAIFFGVAIGTLLAIIGLIIIKKSRLVANGLLFAGVLTAVFSRVLVSLASLGNSVAIKGIPTIAYIEFVILIVLSGAIIVVGLYTLHEEHPSSATPPASV